MITIAPDADPRLSVSTASLTRFLNRARTAVGLTGNVDVLLTTDLELKRLNRTFRHKNRSTDILSFPAASTPIRKSIAPPEDYHAGDLAISLDTAVRQAERFGHPLPTELRILLLHGLLHLNGLDHETDTGTMASREAELRTRFRLPNTLISRAQALPPSHRPQSLEVALVAESLRPSRSSLKTAHPPTPRKRGPQ